jgi:phage N-6-adenine-methyltransferase
MSSDVQERLAGHEPEAGDDDYATPPSVWRPLSRGVDGFDVDPASGAESTPIASTRYTQDDNGLAQAWHGDVWLNPPWSTDGDGSAKDEWLRKARNEAQRPEVRTVTVLLPADTSAHWFHDHVLAAPVVCLVGPGRIAFEGESRNPSFQTVMCVYGDPPDDLVDALDEHGAVFRGREFVDGARQQRLGTTADNGEDSARNVEGDR